MKRIVVRIGIDKHRRHFESMHSQQTIVFCFYCRIKMDEKKICQIWILRVDVDEFSRRGNLFPGPQYIAKMRKQVELVIQ